MFATYTYMYVCIYAFRIIKLIDSEQGAPAKYKNYIILAVCLYVCMYVCMQVCKIFVAAGWH